MLNSRLFESDVCRLKNNEQRLWLYEYLALYSNPETQWIFVKSPSLPLKTPNNTYITEHI